LPTVKSTANYQVLRGARIFSPDGNNIELINPQKENLDIQDQGLLIRRYELDNLLVEQAITAGASFEPNLRAVAPCYSSGCVSGFYFQDGKRNSHEERAKLTIIATGADLGIPRQLGLSRENSQSMVGMRAYVKTKSLDPYINIFFNQYILPGYGWIFPVDENTANVGVVSFQAGYNIRAVFNRFLNSRVMVNEKNVELSSDPKGYPIRKDFLSKGTYTDGLLTVGEAAGLVDPFFGGGIAYALQSGELAAQVAIQSFMKNNFSAAGLSVYSKILHQRYSPYFRYAFMLISNFNEPESINSLISLLREGMEIQTSRSIVRIINIHSYNSLWYFIKLLQVRNSSPYYLYKLLTSQYRPF